MRQLSLVGRGWWTLVIALASKPQVLLLDEPLRASPRRARTGLEPYQERGREQFRVLIVEHDIIPRAQLSHAVTVMTIRAKC